MSQSALNVSKFFDYFFIFERTVYMKSSSITGISGSLILKLTGVGEGNSQVKGAQNSSFECKCLYSSCVLFGDLVFIALCDLAFSELSVVYEICMWM